MGPAQQRLSSTGHNVVEMEMEFEMHAIGCQEIRDRYGPYREEEEQASTLFIRRGTLKIQDGPDLLTAQ